MDTFTAPMASSVGSAGRPMGPHVLQCAMTLAWVTPNSNAALKSSHIYAPTRGSARGGGAHFPITQFRPQCLCLCLRLCACAWAASQQVE